MFNSFLTPDCLTYTTCLLRNQKQQVPLVLGGLLLIQLVHQPHASAQPQPIVPEPNSTGTIVNSPSDGQFTIEGGIQVGENLFHSFEKLDLDANQIATFMSHPQIQNILGRVVGGNTSVINGLIEVVGGDSNLLLMNSAGIIFGPNARLNVPAAFNATTATGIGFGNDRWFNAFGENNWGALAGQPTEFRFDSNNPGSILNLGQLAVGAGESLTLLGGTTINLGTIEAEGGTITLQAIPGQKLIRISQEGYLLSLDIPLSESAIAAESAINPQLDLQSLPELLTGGDLAHASSVSVADDGQMTLANRELITQAEPGTAIVSGTIDVSGQTGGEVRVLGTRAIANGTINASGNNGGGLVSIGGDIQNGNLVTNATETLVTQNAAIAADALNAGDGGRVIISSQNTAQFYGNISARGSSSGGNGGVVQISAPDFLEVWGQVDTRSGINGNTGKLLLETSNLEIISVDAGTAALRFADLLDDEGVLGENYSNLDVAVVNSGTTNIVLEASQNLSFQEAVTIGTPDLGLTAKAGDNITVNANLATTSGDITLVADSDNNGVGTLTIQDADISTRGGNVAGSGREISISNSSINVTSLESSGTLTLTGDEIDLIGNNTITGGNLLQLQPRTPSQDITVGGVINDDRLNLDESELAQLQNGFAQIIIGSDESSGTISITGETTFYDPVTLRSPVDSGSIVATDSTIIGADNATISLEANRDIIAGDIYNSGRTVTITSKLGDIDTSAGNIDTSSPANSGGAIAIASETGAIRTGKLNASGVSNGGSIQLEALTEIVTGEINASGRAIAGGNVTLKTSSSESTIGGDIQVTSINAEGGINGGNVEIVSDNFFRSSGSFIAANGEAASLSTIGENNGGTINIQQAGNSTTPFEVGDATVNGTAGAITRGYAPEQTITSGSFTDTYSQNEGNIQITSVPRSIVPPEVFPPEVTPPEEPTGEEPVEEPIREEPIEEPVGEEPVGEEPIEEPVKQPLSEEIIGEEPVEDPIGEEIIGEESVEEPIGEEPTLEENEDISTDLNTIGNSSDREETPDSSDLEETPNLLDLESPDGSLELEETENLSDLEEIENSSPESETDRLIASTFPESDGLEATPIQYADIEIQLDSGSVDKAVTFVDNLFTQQLTGYTRQDYNTNLQPTQQFQAQLTEIERQTGKKTAIIYVLSRPDQLDLILVPPNGKLIYKSVSEATSTKLLKTVGRFKRAVANARSSNQSYLAPAQQLYNWTIAPLKPDLEKLGIDVLVFSMDQGLRSLPIAALHNGEQFLAEEYSLGLIPSIILTDTRYQSLRSAKVLAFGADKFTDFSPLPGVSIELSTITERWPGKAFLNQEFTLDNLKSQRRESPFAIVHLATHAEFRAGTPSNSYIQLWGDKKLRLDQLRRLGWNNPPVELLVLSACRTALGDESAELGFAGLAVQAGVKSALASLWHVSDEGTLALMTEFYTHLRSAPIKAEALQQAQIAMIRGKVGIKDGRLRGAVGDLSLPPELGQSPEKTLSHPYYWSGFTMVGSPW